MLTVVFGIATAVCAFGWLKNRLGLLSLIYYIKWKGFPPPNDEEIQHCSKEAARHFLRLKDQNEP